MANERWLDPLSETIRSRTEALVGAHDLSRQAFGRVIRRGHAWISEFLTRQRGTNDLRLVVAVARHFKVSVDYLVGMDGDRRDADPGLLTIEALWPELKPSERDIVLQLARQLHQLPKPSGR